MAAISGTVAALIGALALGGGAAAASAYSSSKQSKTTQQALDEIQGKVQQTSNTSANEQIQDANEAAKEELRRRARVRALSGGQTLLSSEAALGSPNTLGGKTLLGE